MMARTPKSETPFKLVFRSEVVIPAKVGLASYKVAHLDEGKKDEGIRLHLDLLDEVKVTVEQRMARYQDLMANLYNTKVKHKHFGIWDLVLRKVKIVTKGTRQARP